MRDLELERLVRRFRRRQRWNTYGPCLFILAMVGLCVWRPQFLWDAILAFCGPGAYLVYWISCLHKGLVAAPGVPWKLRLTADVLEIEADGRVHVVPLARVVRAQAFIEDDFDGMKGLEGALVLELDNGLRLTIHAGAERYHELRDRLGDRVTHREV
jgi:hypothetical protein